MSDRHHHSLAPRPQALRKERAKAANFGEPVIDEPGKGAFWATDLHGV